MLGSDDTTAVPFEPDAGAAAPDLSFLDAVCQPIAALDRDGCIQTCNAAFRQTLESLYGIGPSLGSSFPALLDRSGDGERLTGLIDRALGGEAFTVELEVGDPALRRSLLAAMLAPIRSAGGGITGVAFSAQDITEVKRERMLLMESERRFRDLAANVPGVIYEWVERADGTSGFLWVSPRLEELFRIDRNQLARMGDYIHPDDRDRWRQSIEEAKRRAGIWNFEGRLLYPDGSVRWWQGISRPSRVTAEETVFNGVMLDITDRKTAEQDLVLAAKVFEGSREAVMILDDQGRVLSVNRAFTAITGFRAEEVRKAPLNLFDPARYDPDFLAGLWASASRDAGWEGEVWLRRRDELAFPARLRVGVVRGADERPSQYFLIFEDISERKAQEDRIRHLAQHDFLTGLPNRALLEDRLKQAVPLAQRNGTRLGVMFLDLDRFKIINDSLGHETGDALLKQVARRLIGCVRAADTVSRQGGDEFVILLQDLDTPDHAAAVARKVLEVLAEPFVLDGLTLSVTPSMGIAVFPDDGADFQTLLKNADAAMYHAKSLGRNNFQFFTPAINARVLERVDIESRLRTALQAGDLRLWYQPRFDLRSRAITGLEALLRWPDGSGGYISPERFIPVAEDSGLIVALGDWVLDELGRHLRGWREERVPVVPVSANVSAAQFRQRGLARRIAVAVEKNALDHHLVTLDIPEMSLMQDPESARQALTELHALGIRLSVDDFGTGFSSLAHLKRLPIDSLKIDRSLVHGVPGDDDTAQVTLAIIGLARSLGMRTLAEGVETREQLEFFRYHGCNEAQGFLLAHPMPAEAVPAWLTSFGGAAAGAPRW